MDSILAPLADGSFETLFGRNNCGLFLQRLQKKRFLFRHTASGLSLFYLIGDQTHAQKLQDELVVRYNFERDSTWVLKGQGEIHRVLQQMGLGRKWLQRAWHYDLGERL